MRRKIEQKLQLRFLVAAKVSPNAGALMLLSVRLPPFFDALRIFGHLRPCHLEAVLSPNSPSTSLTAARPSTTAMADTASFADFVKDAREKKKNEVLAQQFLGSGSRGRKSNASGAGALTNSRPNSQKPSLLSRMSGVQKPRSASAKPAANIDGKWQHDLHKLNNPKGPPPKKLNRTASASPFDRNSRIYDRFTSVFTKNVENARANNANDAPGFNIRGVASGGPFTVMASNFAPGTTAADIEAVMAPHGGETLGCKVVSASPTVMVEIIFATREGADNVIATFNNKKVRLS